MIYPVHDCLQCKEPTTQKTYCKKCLKIIKKPQFVHATKKYIFADEAPMSRYQRKEDVTNSKG